MATRSTNYALTFAVLGTAALAFALLQSLIIPAIPQLEQTLHTSESGASWLLTAYLLSAAIATPILGRVGDMLGKEKIIVAVLIALTVGSLLSALATSLPLMLVGRVIQGTGGAVFPLAFGIIRDEFPAERVAGAIGVMSAILGRRCRSGDRAGRPDPRAPELPLALLDPDDHVGHRDGRHLPVRVRIARAGSGPHQLARGGPHVGLAGDGPARHLLRAHVGLGRHVGDRAADRHRGPAGGLGGGRRTAPTRRWWT